MRTILPIGGTKRIAVRQLLLLYYNLIALLILSR